MKTPALALLLGLAAALATPVAQAHGSKPHEAKPRAAKPEQKAWGIAGERKFVRRIVEIEMTDDMRFKPDRIEVGLNETVRFVLKNKGKLLHEMVIGTKKELDEHAALMQKFPDMEHDEPHMAHVDAGKQGDLVWKFNRAGEFDFACLIPGHYQAGMVGKILVKAK